MALQKVPVVRVAGDIEKYFGAKIKDVIKSDVRHFIENSGFRNIGDPSMGRSIGQVIRARLTIGQSSERGIYPEDITVEYHLGNHHWMFYFVIIKDNENIADVNIGMDYPQPMFHLNRNL